MLPDTATAGSNTGGALADHSCFACLHIAMLRCRATAVCRALPPLRPARTRRCLIASAVRPFSTKHSGVHEAAVGGAVAGKPSPVSAASSPSPSPDSVTERQMLQTVGHHLWPAGPGHVGLKTRVVASVGLLVGSKLMTIEVSAGWPIPDACATASG